MDAHTPSKPTTFVAKVLVQRCDEGHVRTDECSVPCSVDLYEVVVEGDVVLGDEYAVPPLSLVSRAVDLICANGERVPLTAMDRDTVLPLTVDEEERATELIIDARRQRDLLAELVEGYDRWCSARWGGWTNLVEFAAWRASAALAREIGQTWLAIGHTKSLSDFWALIEMARTQVRAASTEVALG